MHLVAHHLQLEAVKRTEISEQNLYARSAFNRYYYDLFLMVREMLIELQDAKWSSLTHSSYPGVLDKIAKDFIKEKNRARKNGDFLLVAIVSQAISASKEISKLMEKAYAVRVVADYDPTEFVNFTSATRFSLKNIEITDAHEWRNAVQLWIEDIKKAWQQIYV